MGVEECVEEGFGVGVGDVPVVLCVSDEDWTLNPLLCKVSAILERMMLKTYRDKGVGLECVDEPA